MNSPDPIQPPHWAHRLLTWLHPENTLEEVEGDLDELYGYWHQRAGKNQATLRYVLNVVSVLPPFVRRRQRKQEYTSSEYRTTFFLSPDMIRNYLKIAWRNLLRHPLFSFINVLGLALGLACCMLILLFVQDELRYDRFHTNAGRIYRLTADLTAEGKTSHLSVTPAPWATILTTTYSQAIKAVRLFKDKKSLVRFGEKRFYENRLFLADSTLFDVFTLPLLKGDPVRALTAPNSVVLTQQTARKYFGETDPIGKVLELSPSFRGTYALTVTGITSDLPANSHLQFDMLVSLSTIGKMNIDQMWEFFMFHTYLLLPDGYSPQQLEAQLPDFVTKHMGKYVQSMGKIEAHLQPLTDIHLHSQLDGELEPNGNILYVRVFSAIAIVILLIAAINFMNLSTARSLKRAKEVGLRKAVGAQRIELIRQFLGESVLLALLALVFSMAFLFLLFPVFNQLSDKNLPLSYLYRPSFLGYLFGLSIAVGVVAGSYPAVVLSYFKPAQVLKGNFGQGSQGQWLRKSLIVVQFGISSMLIIGTVVIYQQLDFIRNKNLGFDQQQVIVLSAPGYTNAQQAATFKNALKRRSTIVGVATSSDVPGRVIPANLFHGEGSPSDQHESMQMLAVDEDFVPAMSMKLAAGRNFSRAFPTDEQEGFIINEEAVRQLGWPSATAAIGKKFEWVMSDRVLKSGKVIGVVRDFNLKPLDSKVAPTVLLIEPNRFQYLYVRVRPGNPVATLDFLNEQMHLFYPDQPFEFTFLDETIQTMYRRETQLGAILGWFSALAILIGCLGIFGLATYTAQQRIKEIGIRKVLGASVVSVFALLSNDFLKLVLIAIFIASPVAWWAMNQWLAGFVYHIHIEWWVFALTSLVVMGIALLTVSYQSIKAALVNPVKSLRSE